MVVAVDHEEGVRLPRELVEAAQVAQRHLAGHVLADAHHLEIHQGADASLGVGQGGLQLRALVDVLRLDDVLDHLVGQVGREVGDLVGVQVLGGGDDLRGVHVREQRVADGVGDLEEDVAVAVAAHEAPDDEALLEGQALEDEGDVGRVQPVEPLLQLGEVLLVDDGLDEPVPFAVAALPVDELLHQALLGEQPRYRVEMFLRRGGARLFGGEGHRGRGPAGPGGSPVF